MRSGIWLQSFGLLKRILRRGRLATAQQECTISLLKEGSLRMGSNALDERCSRLAMAVQPIQGLGTHEHG